VQSIRERVLDGSLSWRAILVIVAVGALILLIVVSPFLLGGGTEVEVTGVVVGPLEMPSETGHISFLLVTVEAGEEVRVPIRVPISRELLVRPGNRVVLAKRTEPRLGVVQYRFVRYADAGA
jgi:hypothetical protein